MFLVATHNFVHSLEVTDVAQDLLEQVGLTHLRFLLNALECEVHEVVNVGQECVGVVEQEVLPFVELVFDAVVQFFAQVVGFDLQEVDLVYFLECEPPLFLVF